MTKLTLIFEIVRKKDIRISMTSTYLIFQSKYLWTKSWYEWISWQELLKILFHKSDKITSKIIKINIFRILEINQRCSVIQGVFIQEKQKAS
jgi:K+ transporter